MPRLLYPGKEPRSHWAESRMGPRASLDILEKINITGSYHDSNPGPPSPQSNCHTKRIALVPWTTVCKTIKTTGAMYAASLRIIVAVEKQYEYYLLDCVCVCGNMGAWVCACSLANPACNTNAPYCDIIWGPSVSTRFFNTISQMMRFSGKSYWTWNVFSFSLQLLSNTFPILGRS
jgi:hypothetical protein